MMIVLMMFLVGCATTPQPLDHPLTAKLEHFEKNDMLATMTGAKVAVLPFAANPSSIGWEYAEEFSLFMGKLRRFDMIERMQVKKLLEEQDFNAARIDDAAAVRIGKLVGAKGIVLGSISDCVNVRLVDTETGLLVWNARLIPTGETDNVASASVRRKASAVIAATLAEAALGFLGADVAGMTDQDKVHYHVTDARGAVVTDVIPSSNARGILAPGDVIREIDGIPTYDVVDVVLATFGKKPGDKLNFSVRRGSRLMSVSVALIPRPF